MKKLFFLTALLCASVAMFAQATAPNAAPTAPTVPPNQVKSLYSDSYNTAGTWGYNENWSQTTTLTTLTIEENNILHYNNFNYLGWQGTPVNAISMEKVHLDIWVASDASIRFFPIYGDGGSLTTDDSHYKVLNLTGQQWNSFDLTLATDFAGLDLSSIFQLKFDQGPTEFFVDNVYFYTTVDPGEDTTAPSDFTASIPSTSYFSLTVKANATDASGSVNYSVINGELVVASGTGISGADTYITVSGLSQNTEYNLKVVASDESGNSTDPIAVNGTTLTAPAAAPAPTATEANVKSIYSDDYTAATTVSDYRQNWWMGADLFTGKLSADDNVLYYVATTDGGAHGWAFDQFDATGFTKLHVSIYPLNAGSFRIYPVVTGTTEADYYRDSETLTANQWNEVIFDFSTVALDKVKQIGWNSYYALGSFFIDNVYFFKDTTTAIDNTEVEAKAVKVIENGQLFIIKNGVKYNALGTEVR